MSIATVKNLKTFLERSQAQGMECYAWVDAHKFVLSMIQDLEKPPESPTPTEDTHD